MSEWPERRSHARHTIHRPVKIRCGVTGRYLTGRTQDISTNGALIEVDYPLLLARGQSLKIGIAWTDRDVVIRSSEMSPAQVRRSLGMGSVQHVAVQFDLPVELAATA